jgi:truncated hemoglobin YjbI
MAPPALFEKIGPERLRAVIADFYDRLFGDVMIGFLFAGKDKQRLIAKEYELTARFLGAGVAYTGRPMREAHARSPILGGHFERRMEILRQTLAAHAVDPDVATSWIEHQLALRPQITPDRGSECKDSTAAERIQVAGPPPAADPDRVVRLGKRRP